MRWSSCSLVTGSLKGSANELRTCAIGPRHRIAERLHGGEQLVLGHVDAVAVVTQIAVMAEPRILDDQEAIDDPLVDDHPFLATEREGDAVAVAVTGLDRDQHVLEGVFDGIPHCGTRFQASSSGTNSGTAFSTSLKFLPVTTASPTMCCPMPAISVARMLKGRFLICPSSSTHSWSFL